MFCSIILIRPATGRPVLPRCPPPFAQDQQKLLAAVAAVDIAAARVPLHQTAEDPQYLVTGKMSIAVIDRLEMVEITHDHADGMTMALGQDQLPA